MQVKVINEFIDAFNYFGDVKFDVQKVTLDSLTDEGVRLAVFKIYDDFFV
jgi:hypothetical protein